MSTRAIRRALALLALAAAALLVPHLRAAEAPAPAPANGDVLDITTEALLRDLTEASSHRQRKRTMTAIVNKQRALCRRLTALITPERRDQLHEETCAIVALTLGELRCKHAVDVLAAGLEVVHDPPVFGAGVDRDFPRACGIALREIGRPSVPTMAAILDSRDGELVRARAMDVLYHVLGGQRRLVEFIEKLKARAAGDPAKVTRLTRALDRARNHYKEDVEPLY